MAGAFRGARVGYYRTRSLDAHVRLILQQFRKSLADPETHRLAGKIVSGTGDWITDPRDGRRVQAVSAWGQWYRQPVTPAPGRARDDAGDIARIWNFCVLNVRYMLDADGIDVFHTVRETLERHAGDCDDFVILSGALLTAVGFPCAMRVISTDRKAWEHIYLLVGYPKEGRQEEWIPLDPTVQGKHPGWQFDATRGGAYRDFLLSA